MNKPPVVLFLAAAVIIAALAMMTRGASSPVAIAPVTYPSQEECEKTTRKPCDFVMCDYIPEGKTFEEVCGKGFKKGWAPNAQPAAGK